MIYRATVIIAIPQVMNVSVPVTHDNFADTKYTLWYFVGYNQTNDITTAVQQRQALEEARLCRLS